MDSAILTCLGRFVRKRNLSSFPAKNGKHAEWAALRVVVVWAWTKHQRVLGEFPPIPIQNYLKSKSELSWSDWRGQAGALLAAVTDQQDESSSSSDTSSSSYTESDV